MDYERAASFWDRRPETKLNDEIVRKKAEDFLGSHKVCALAAGSGDFVRNTPIEYTFLDGCFYLLSEGGLKFKALKDNKNVCLAVFDGDGDFSKLSSLQVSGRADIIEPFSEEYVRLLKVKKIPEEVIRKMKEPMNLIKVTPIETDLLFTEFKKLGGGARQHLSGNL